MIRRPFVLLVPFVLAAVLTACTDDDPALEAPSSTTSEASPSTTEPTSTTGVVGEPAPTSTTTPEGEGVAMSGADGASGRVAYTLSVERSEFCYRITIDGLGSPMEAHVHRRDGEVVLALQAPEEDGTVNTCAATDALLIEELDSMPQEFYADVHGSGGVLRATLQ